MRLFILLISLASVSYAQTSKTAVKPKVPATTKTTATKTTTKPASLKTRVDTVSYYIGTQIGGDMKKNHATDINPAALAKGLEDALKGTNPLVDPQTGSMYTQAYFGEIQKKKTGESDAIAKKFFDENGKRPGVKTTASGLQYEIVKDTAGQKPVATDIVKVNYKGTLLNGTVFDATEGRGPATFPLNQVIPGWTEGLQLMTVGSKFKFYIPGRLAYGEQGVQQAGIGPNETLVFEVELLSIEKPQPPAPQVPQVPSNVNPNGQ